MALPFWIPNLTQDRLDALERRWASPLTQAQLRNPWQRVLVDGAPLPGVWSLRKVGRKLRAQPNKKSGADGGPATIRGLENPNFKLYGELYIPSHLAAWVELVPKLDVVGDPAKRAQHLIEHPLCGLTGVRGILFLEVEYDLPEEGGPLKISLGLLGESTRDGATKTPQAKPTPTAATASVPVIPIQGAQAPAQNLPQYVIPPGAAR